MKKSVVFLVMVGFLAAGCSPTGSTTALNKKLSLTGQKGDSQVKKIIKSAEEWKEILTPEQYSVMRQKETEIPYTGCFNGNSEAGIYLCAACKTPLFSSESQYDHGGAWPSFSAIYDGRNVTFHEDHSHSMHRIEVRCAVCESHLGHVFNDGPPPDGIHYCINSIALEFQPKGTESSAENDSKAVPILKKTESAVFAAGCFWGVEYKFGQIDGVLKTRVGYTGGKKEKPTYRQVCSGTTGHAEAIEIIFDPERVTYEKLLDHFFKLHDPTQFNRQGPDVGEQYRSAVFYLTDGQKEAAEMKIRDLNRSGRYQKPIVTKIIPASEFYEAEEYHQKYYEKRK